MFILEGCLTVAGRRRSLELFFDTLSYAMNLFSEQMITTRVTQFDTIQQIGHDLTDPVAQQLHFAVRLLFYTGDCCHHIYCRYYYILYYDIFSDMLIL